MSSETWACFDCRETVRRPNYTKAEVLCPDCGLPCVNLGHKLRLPPKRQTKAWQEIRAELRKSASTEAELKEQLRLERMRTLREEIARLKAKGPNAGREKQIRMLRLELASFEQNDNT